MYGATEWVGMQITTDEGTYETVEYELAEGNTYWNSYDGELYHLESLSSDVATVDVMFGTREGETLEMDREQFNNPVDMLHRVERQ